MRRALVALVQHPYADMVVIALILVSVGLVLAEYSLDLDPPWVQKAGIAINTIFALELAVRYAAARKKGRFFRRYVTDILSLLSFGSLFRYAALLRLLRLFRLGLLMSRRVPLLRGVLRVNLYELWVLVVITGILTLSGGVFAYLTESGRTPGFETWSASMWWALHSIVAGEPIGPVPSTPAGHVVLLGVMLSGMMLFATFTGVVSATIIERMSGREGVGEMDMDELEDHIVVCGWNAGIRAFLTEIALDRELCGKPVVLLNQLPSEPNLAGTGYREELIYFLKGDHTKLDNLKKAGVGRASRAVVLADALRGSDPEDRDARTVLAALTIEKLKPGIHCTVELMVPSNESHLRVAGVEAIVMRNELAGSAIATACRNPELINVLMEIITLTHGQTLQRIPGPTKRSTYKELLIEHRGSENALVIGVERAKAGPDEHALLNPPDDYPVEPGDWLIILSKNVR